MMHNKLRIIIEIIKQLDIQSHRSFDRYYTQYNISAQISLMRTCEHGCCVHAQALYMYGMHSM